MPRAAGLDPGTGVTAALQALVAAYAAAADARDGQALAALFADDATFVAHQRGTDVALRELRGHAELAKLVDGLAPFEQTQHLMAGVHVTAVGDGSASAVVEGEAHHLLDRGDGVEDLVMRLRYEDAFVVQEGTWRFARRAMRVRWASWLPVEAEPLAV